MAEFVKRKKAEKLLKTFEEAVTDNGQLAKKNPLYTRVHENGRYSFQIETPFQKFMKLMNKHNGYGEPQIFGKMDTQARDEFDGNFRRMLSKPVGIETLDAKMLSQLMFMFNRSLDRENRLVAEKISDGTIVKILTRAIELGSYKKDKPQSDLAAPGAAP